MYYGILVTWGPYLNQIWNLGRTQKLEAAGKRWGGVSGDRHAERKRPLCGITCHAILWPRSLELLCYVLRIACSPFICRNLRYSWWNLKNLWNFSIFFKNFNFSKNLKIFWKISDFFKNDHFFENWQKTKFLNFFKFSKFSIFQFFKNFDFFLIFNFFNFSSSFSFLILFWYFVLFWFLVNFP